jgi:hypothetical protein
MARDAILLGPGPAAESAAPVGDSGYAEIACLQGRRYIGRATSVREQEGRGAPAVG